MNKYLFYTDEGVTLTPSGKDIENLQILGIETGENSKMALKSLFKENDWIIDSGFNPDNIEFYRLCI